LYDTLVADPSPRVQILTTGVYVKDDDPTPTALRPKRADVIARAVDFAPDDAFVQWRAAKSGNYFSSKCGPTRWPEAEVANLVRLEPDNAGAWQYAVALAQSKGEPGAVDEALSRMAAASRADDHLIDEIAAWKAAYVAHPEIASGAEFGEESWLKSSEKGTFLALEKASFGSHDRSTAALTEACTPDADSDRTWRRLGWCADAGRVLAEKGNSLALRANGLAMLKAAGQSGGAIEKAERQYDWLVANDANQMENPDGDVDFSAALGDWTEAKSELDAIEHRLKRLGLPLTPPPEWSKAKAPSPSDNAQAFAKAFAEYMAAVVGDMRASASPEARAFVAVNSEYVTAFASMGGGENAPTPDAAKEGASVATLAQANATNLEVQWMIATASHAPDDAKTNAIATVQQAEPDNAGAWALSLEHVPPTDSLADTLLQRMAASKRYDTHSTYGGQVILDAMRKRPMPAELVALGQSIGAAAGENMTGEALAKALALSVSYMGMMGPAELAEACNSTNAAAGTPRHDSCVAIGQLLVRNGATMLDVNFGESILTHLGALAGADAERVRQVKWWYESMSTETPPRAMPTDAVLAYIDDYIATGNEVEALRRYASKAGRSDPPPGWTPRKTRR
ncbi:MAG TPA: hypothetical protein VFV97_07180, partial [Rhodanobacteraceae bacterium]|nr:hypothetical protein [Rhodanobacteraceae bacterium]